MDIQYEQQGEQTEGIMYIPLMYSPYSLKKSLISALKTFILSPLAKSQQIFQTQDGHKQIISEQIPRYQGIIGTIKRLQREQGKKVLYRGASLQFIVDVIKNYLFYPFVEKSLIKTLGVYPVVNIPMLSLISNFVFYPVDLVMSRIQGDIPDKSGKLQYQGVIDCIRKIYQKQGIKGFYSKIDQLLVPQAAFNFSLAFIMKKVSFLKMLDFIMEYLPSNPISQILLGIPAVLLLCVIVQPINVVQQRLLTSQLELQDQDQDCRVKYDGFVDCAKQIIQQEGIQGLFKGSLSSITQQVTKVLLLNPALDKL